MLVAILVSFASLLATASSAQAMDGASLVLDRNSGQVGTLVSATYTAPGCGPDVSSTVAFSLDSIAGRQFGTSTMNPSTCSSTLKFAISGSPGVHQVFGYIPNSGAPVGSAPFTILSPPDPTPVLVPTSAPTPVPTPVASPSATAVLASQNPSSSPIAVRSAAHADRGLNGFLVPLLIALIILLVAALVILLVMLRSKSASNRAGPGPENPQTP